MNQGMFLKFAGLSKFCYKEMELPIEKNTMTPKLTMHPLYAVSMLWQS